MAMSPQDEHALHVTTTVVVSVVGASLAVALILMIWAITVTYGRPVTTYDPGRDPENAANDPAWPHYFRASPGLDFKRLRGVAVGSYKRLFKKYLIPLWPVFAIAGPFLLVLVLVWGISVLTARVVVGGLFWLGLLFARGAEAVYAKAHKAEASCPSCFAVMDRPAYKCPGCGKLHRDIRPGKQGAFFRVCTCDRRLPTGVVRASWQLDAVCQHCGADVHRGAAVLQDVRVPVFGEPHAGKTRLIFAGFHDIVGQAKARGFAVSFPDKSSKERAEHGLTQIASDLRTIKTEWQLDPALTCQIGAGTKGALLHAFDAAGERFRGDNSHDELRFLEDGHTLVFVVDPFAVPGIRDKLASQPRSDVLDEHLSERPRNPEDAYGEVVSRVQTSGTSTKKQRLAVVVTKADVLGSLGVSVPTDHEAIRQWLYDNGLHNVVLAASREFREARYFAVASVDSKKAGEYRAATPFIWAMSTRGFIGLGPATETAKVGAA